MKDPTTFAKSPRPPSHTDSRDHQNKRDLPQAAPGSTTPADHLHVQLGNSLITAGLAGTAADGMSPMAFAFAGLKMGQSNSALARAGTFSDQAWWWAFGFPPMPLPSPEAETAASDEQDVNAPDAPTREDAATGEFAEDEAAQQPESQKLGESTFDHDSIVSFEPMLITASPEATESEPEMPPQAETEPVSDVGGEPDTVLPAETDTEAAKREADEDISRAAEQKSEDTDREAETESDTAADKDEEADESDAEDPQSTEPPDAEAEAEKEDVPPDEVTADAEQEHDAGQEVSAESQKQDGPGTELQVWKAQARGAIDKIPEPTLREAPQHAERVRAGGAATRARQSAARQEIPGQTEEALAETPSTAKPEPPETDPVPEATRLVVAESRHKLTDQTLPQLNTSPRSTRPVLGTIPNLPEQPPKEPEETNRSQPAGDNQSTPEQNQADRVEQARRDGPAEAEKRSEPEPPTLADEGARPSQPLPAPARALVGDVIAQLLQDPGEQAQTIVDEARAGLYEGTVESEYPEIGNALVGDVTSDLNTQLRGIAAEAGLTKEALDEKIADHTRALEEKKNEADANNEQAGQETRQTQQEEQEKTSAAITDSARDASATINKNVEAATGKPDPTLINAQRDRLIRRIQQQVALHSSHYKRTGRQRAAMLRKFEDQYINAYRRVGQIDTKAVLAELKAEDGEESFTHRFDSRYIRALKWPQKQITAVQNLLRGYQRDATNEGNGFSTKVREAGGSATELIRSWAAEKTGEQRNWFTRLFDEMMDWAQQARADVEMQTSLQNQQMRNSILIDLGDLESDLAKAGTEVNLETLDERRDLTDRQKAVIRAYYSTSGDEREKSLAAVAASLRHRVNRMHRPKIVDHIRKKLLEVPQGEWSKLSVIAKTEGGRFNALERARKLRGAMSGLGTNERRVHSALANLTPLKHAVLRKCYASTYGHSLESALRDELSGDDLVRAISAGDKAAGDAVALHEATAGKFFGTNEAAVMRVLRNKAPEERRRIEEEYRRLYNVDLRDHLKDDLNDIEMERADALLDGNTELADAIGLDDALNGGWFGGDVEETDAIYQQIRRDVAEQHPDWTTAEVEAEILRRNQKVEETYNSERAEEDDTREGSALRAAMKSRLTGPERDLAYALADNDLAKADAARVRIEEKSFYADDDAINAVLRGQYERAVEQVRRDQMPAMRAALRQRMQERAQAGYPMTQDEIHAAHRAMNREIEESARIGGMANMKELEDTFASEYPTWLGPGSLKAVIQLNMSGDDEEFARHLVEQGGYMTPAHRMQYAIEGAGTDEDGMKEALKGRTAVEIEVIKREYRERTGRDLVVDIEEEFGWDAHDDDHDVERDLFDIRELMHGEPIDAEQRMESLERKRNYERNAYGSLSAWLASEDYADLELEYQEAKARYEKLSDPSLSVEEHNALQRRFEDQSELTLHAIDQVRQGVDELADTLSTIGAVVAAVVVIIVAAAVIFFSGGTATPGVVAAFSAALSSWSVAATAAGAAAAATVVTKQLVKGDDYTIEEMGADVAVGVVDAATAALTAGIGTALMKVGMLGRMGASKSVGVRMLANGLAEGIEGAVSSVPAALTGNLAREENWEKGNPVANILGGTLIETGIATGLGGGLGSLGGIARSVDADGVLPPMAGRELADETGDILSKRGTPAERAALWNDYQLSNPGSRYTDFLAELDSGLIARQADEAAVSAAQRNLRRNFLHDIPPAQRRQFAEMPIEILTDADFGKVTRGFDGPAAVIMHNGRPHVILREGADPKALRDVGRKLDQQVKATANKVSPDSPEVLETGLPRDLRKKVPLEVDPDMPPKSVRVHYDIGPDGLPANIRMRVGRGASRGDIELHVKTVRKMDNLSGISGRVRVLLERIKDWVSRNGRPPIGSRAWEARLELEKLPGILRERMHRLAKGDLTPAEFIDLDADIRHLRGQVRGYQAALDEMDVNPGRGFVAAEGPGRSRKPRRKDRSKPRKTEQSATPAVDADDVPEVTPPGPQLPPPVSKPQRIRELLIERSDLAQQLEALNRRIRSLDELQYRLQLRNDTELEKWAAAKRVSVEDLPDYHPRLKPAYDNAEARRMAALAQANEIETELRGLNAEYNQLTGRLPGGDARWEGFTRRGYAAMGTDPPPCFPAGTLVRTPQGLVCIENLSPGQEVLAFDDHRGSVISRAVVRIHQNRTNRLVRLQLPDECVAATSGHPFWCVESEQWVRAEDLRSGKHLLMSSGETLQIQSTRIERCRTATWNLEVDDSHNFFAGRSEVLVHNANDSGWKSPKRKLTTIYAVFDGDTIIYIGKTFQGEPGDPKTRFGQHVVDKKHWKAIEDRLTIEPVKHGNWTPFETAVWEQHFMAMYRRDSHSDLQNAVAAITKENFEEFSKPRYGFQPC